MKEIESGHVSEMVDSSSTALLAEINSKCKKGLIWPWILGLTLLAAFLTIGSPWFFYLVVPVSVISVFGAAYADKLRKTIVLFYELDPQIEQTYQKLHAAFDSFWGCSRVWHIQSSGQITTTYDWKVNAGAATLVNRKGINAPSASSRYFQCNISIPVLSAGRQTLYFLPDRVLVWDTNGVGAVGFEQLDINFGERRFIEGEGVPRDARVVDKTWRYVNKKGGPDKRFNNNREIPIVLYEEILITSKSGLRELFQTSRTGIGVQLKAAVEQIASAIAQPG